MSCCRFLIGACLTCLSTALLAQQELPNFELGLGGGLGHEMPVFNLDITVNVPLTKRFSSQINLDSDYIFGDPEYGDYAMSELNALGFYRVPKGRLGGGLGILQKKSRYDSFATEQVAVTHLLASYYIDDVTLDWRYAEYNRDLDRSVSLQLGALWYPSPGRRVSIYRENYDGAEGWRIEAFVQPEQPRRQMALGIVVRDGVRDFFPYIGVEMQYYFDRSVTIKDRDRRYH